METQRVWRWKRAEVERRQERETKGRFTARGTRRDRRARIREEEERRRRVAERTSFWGKRRAVMMRLTRKAVEVEAAMAYRRFPDSRYMYRVRRGGASKG